MTQICAVCRARRDAGLRILAASAVEFAGFAVASHFHSNLIAAFGASTTIMMLWSPCQVLWRLNDTACK